MVRLGDVVYTLRQWRNSPGFMITAVATLALGIGGTTAMFSLMHDIMLRSLPVTAPETLYRIGAGSSCCVQGGPQDQWGMFPYPLYQKLQTTTPEFEELTAFQASIPRYSVLRPGVDPVARPFRGELVTGTYFSVFGIRPFAGRLFQKSDDVASAPPVIVLSYRSWISDWGGKASAVGSIATIQGQPFTVIGIAPPGFYGETLRSHPPDFWIPLQQEPLLMGKDSILRQSVSSWLRVIGRAKPGANMAGVSPRLTEMLRRWMMTEAGYPQSWMSEIQRSIPKQSLEVIPAGNGVAAMKEEYGRSLQILLAVCALVLLIACANVANLLIARGMARRTQTSIRLAIGASRGRLVSQALVESVLLAIGGGLAGLLVAFAAEKMLIALTFHDATYLPISTTPSLPVLGFTFGLSLLTGLLFGAAPAWISTRRDPVEALRGANRSTGDHSSVTRKVLLVLQATLSVVLVAGAAMLTRSLSNLERQDFGYRTDGLVMVGLNPLPSSYAPDRLDAVYRAVRERLAQIPGVEGVGLALFAPLTDQWGEIIMVDGRPQMEINESMAASWDRISPGYFETIGQPVLRGRGITDADTTTTETVAVVNEAFVKRFFPNEEALDKRFGIDDPSNTKTYRIVGVVRNAKYSNPTEPPRPMFFAALSQYTNYKIDMLQMVESRSHFIESIMLRTRMSPGTLEPLLRKTLGEVDPNFTVVNVRGMNDFIGLVFDQQRAVARLAGVFGLIALLLAAVGLYGVTAYSVVQRTSEIGVRMALGADTFGVQRLVLAGAFKMVGIGLVLGIPLAVGSGKLIATQLYGVQAMDPLAIGVAVVGLGISGFAAAVIPAVRAASIDPMRALRSE